MSGDKPLISIDVGSPISLKAEVKTEIPAESSGRLLDALTDAIRPFTETRGLRADQIRLQRAEVAVEIAKLAQEKVAIEGGAVHPVSTKFLIPFLEKASLEDQGSDLVDKWASLLASVSLDPGDDATICTSILAELGPGEAALLDRIQGHLKRQGVWPCESVSKIEKAWSEFLNSNYDVLQNGFADYAEGSLSWEEFSSVLQKASDSSPNLIPNFFFSPKGGEARSTGLNFSDKERVAIDVLTYRNLVRSDEYWKMLEIGKPSARAFRGTLTMRYFLLTNLGLRFLRRVSIKSDAAKSAP